MMRKDRLVANVAPHTVSFKDARIVHLLEFGVLLLSSATDTHLSYFERVIHAPFLAIDAMLLSMCRVVLMVILRILFPVFAVPLGIANGIVFVVTFAIFSYSGFLTFLAPLF